MYLLVCFSLEIPLPFFYPVWWKFAYLWYTLPNISSYEVGGLGEESVCVKPAGEGYRWPLRMSIHSSRCYNYR